MDEVIAIERLHNALIIVVDDVELNRKMLSHNLRGRGFTNVITADDGEQALQMTRELKPDLVILDLMMPGMDGFAYCEEIRKDRAYDNMPIIVQTALNEMDHKLRVFDLGASDYICKPVDPGELNARTQVHLTKKMLVEDLRSYQRRVSAELDSARMMQNRLMPAEQQLQMCERVFDMRIASYFETSSTLGGDCWGIHPLSDKRLAIYMYDFSGHGMPAAMNVFRMHTIMQEFLHDGSEPGHFLSLLNRHLYSLLERDEFATMFYGVIDTDANCLLYASAAVPPAILFSTTDAEPISLHNRGFPLGVIPNAAYETKYTPFVAGDLLLLYSDCLIETKDANSAFLNESDIKSAITAAAMDTPNPAKCSVEVLTKLFHDHSKAPIHDDFTINAYWRCLKAQT